MNRTFIADLTPARARLIMMMNRYQGMKIDSAVIAKAEEGRLSPALLSQYGIEDDLERLAVQFITDMNFRAGLPTPEKLRPRRLAIINAALAIAGVEHIEISKDQGWNGNMPKFDVDYQTLLPHRKKVVVIDIDNAPEISIATTGRMFPRIILHGNMRVQYAFSFGARYSASSQIGEVLFPAVFSSIEAPYKKDSRNMILATGVFPEFLEGNNIGI